MRRSLPWWREGLLGLVLALPWLSLLVLGAAWLWQSGRVLEWAVGAAVLALLAWPLRRAVRRRAADRLAATLAARRSFDPGEDSAEDKAARALVEARIAAAGPIDLSDREAVERSLREVIEAVARHYHPAAKRPTLQVTPPELLLLLERLSNRLRGFIRDVPFADRTTLDRMATAGEFWTKHGGTLTRAYEVADAAWRMSRFARNPASAVLREAARIADVSTSGIFSDMAGQQAHRALIREAGDAAIALYSGRLRMTEAELAALAPPAPEERPLHLAILGRPGAGVTTLAALLEEPAKARGFALLERGRWQGADAVLLLSPALRPDRAEDLALLEQVRQAAGLHPPPILLAMTGADLLPPGVEAEAAAAVAEALDMDRAVPLALPPGGAPRGLDRLLAALEREKAPARRARGERLRAAGRKLDLGSEAGKAWRTGRALLDGFTRRK